MKNNNLECYYEMTKDEYESSAISKARASVLEMFGNPYSPAWMPEAILTAIKYSKLYGECGVEMFALCSYMEKRHFTLERTFVRELILEINRTYNIFGEHCPIWTALQFCEITGKDSYSLGELCTMQKRLQKARACEFEKQAA
ncbi:MAG: hypothetical protein WCT39_03640 [Candidatus Margulisiibacteriota bacterium]